MVLEIFTSPILTSPDWFVGANMYIHALYNFVDMYLMVLRLERKNSPYLAFLNRVLSRIKWIQTNV